MKKIFILTAFCFGAVIALFGQYQSKYPDIPIVDVHIHARGVTDVANFMKVSEVVKQKYGSDLAFFIDLDILIDPITEIKAAGTNKFLFAASEMTPHKGITKTPEEIVAMIRDGYVGLKFWFSDPRRTILEGEEGITKVDDPAYEPLFSALERENALMTSFHIADPNGPFHDRQRWMADPVYYWTQIRAFENVVAKYPNLTIVAAHCAWIICQDAQIDYLRYLLSRYPNLYVDPSATFPYMHLVNYDNLRDFYIEYQDRILFGSDIGFNQRLLDEAVERTADRYADLFTVLETDQEVNRGRSKGLNLPREVLEKIYYKNAIRLYPGLKEAMGLK